MNDLAATRPTALGTVANVLWIVLGGGLVTALGYLLGALVLAITIVGLPFAVQAFKLAAYAFLPFDKRVVDRSSGAAGCLYVFANLLWLVVVGWALALAHLSYALGCAVTIIGLPFAYAHLKLALLALWPFGKEIV